MATCKNCGSADTEIYEAEYADEPNVRHCYDCGSDEVL